MSGAANDVEINIRFKDAYGLEQFLYSGVHRILAVKTCDTKLELIRVFEISSECLDNKNISVLHWTDLKCLLSENYDAIMAKLSGLTIIEAFDCKTMEEDNRNTLKHLFECVSNTVSKKVVLIHGSDRLCFKCAVFMKEYYDTCFFKEKKVAKICFEDLSVETQQSFLNEPCISFRGKPMSLKELILPFKDVNLNDIITSTVINKAIFDPRRDSLIEIGRPHVFCYDHFYFKRKFHNEFVVSRQVKRMMFLRKNNIPSDLFIIGGVESKAQLNNDILNMSTGKILNNDNILTFENPEEATSYFQRQPSSIRPIHLIKRIGSGLLIWMSSKGSLRNLRPYVYRNRTSHVTEQELLLKKAVVLSGPLGVGKSTTLATLSAYAAESWTININMSDRTTIVNRLPDTIDENNVIKFLSHWVEEPHFLATGLLNYYLFHSTQSSIYILFDEFDQIANTLDRNCYTCFTRLLNFLKNDSQAHVWITARPENNFQLENALSEFSTEFKQMSLKEERSIMLGMGGNKLMPYPEDIVIVSSFIGRPLILKLLCCDTAGWEWEKAAPTAFALVSRFVSNKIVRYMKNNFENNAYRKQIISYLYEVHEFAAGKLLCLELAELLGNKTVPLLVDIRRVGFISSTANNNFQFVHSIFAQYFASNMFYKWMQNPASCHPMGEFLFSKIFVEPQFKVIRYFLNQKLVKSDTPKISVEKCDKRRALHVLVNEGFLNIGRWFFEEDDFVAVRNPSVLRRMAFDINEIDSYKHVFNAIKVGNLEYVKRLLNYTSDPLGLVYKLTSPSRNALHLAAKLGHKDIVEYLLEIGIPVDIIDNFNATPLQYAAANGHLDVVKLLLSKNADLNHHDKRSKTAFLRSIEKGKSDVVQFLFKEDFWAVATAEDKNGMTALEHAAKLGDKNIVQQLLRKGADVNHRDHFGMNALAWAVTTGDSIMVDFLMSLGAASDVSDRNGRNLIYIALKAKQWHLVPYLTFCLVDVNVPDYNNVTPLELAVATCQKWDIVEHLILEGARVANDDFDPISFAVGAGKPSIALLMVERRSCPMVAQELRETLLNELAVKSGASDDESLLKRLIQLGNLELLHYFLEKKGDSALSEIYEELVIGGLNISEEITSFVERKLVRLRSVAGQTVRLSEEGFASRVEFVCEQISQLKEEVDPQCIIRMRFIAQNIGLLKRASVEKTRNIPWEQMEFCLVIFMNFFVKPCHEDFLYRLVLDYGKLMRYLNTFALYLNGDETCSLKDLETDYRIMKDIYSLNRIFHYIKLVTDIVDYKDEVNTFVLMRSLQVIGESFKNTPSSQNLSQEVHDYLVLHAPTNVKKILTSVRDYLSHSFSYKSKINIEMKLKSDPQYFQTLQNELERIRFQTDFLLYTKKKEVLDMYHRKCVELKDKSESLNQINRYINWESYEEIIRDDYEIMDLKRIKQLIKKLERIVPDNKSNIIKLQSALNDIEKSLYKRLNKAKYEYYNVRTNFGGIDKVQNLQHLQSLKIDFCTTKKSGVYEPAINLLVDLAKSILAKEEFVKKSEASSLCSQLFYLMKWDIHRIKNMQEIYRDLSGKPDERTETNLDNLFTNLEHALEREEDSCSLHTYFSNKKKITQGT